MKQTDKDKTMEGRYRQFAGCDTLKASAKFSMMRDAGLLEMKGRGKATDGPFMFMSCHDQRRSCEISQKERCNG